jgi:transposase-like protein
VRKFKHRYLKKRKADWIGHDLRRNCFVKHVTEGMIEGRIERKGTRERRRMQLMDDFKEGILGTERRSITWHHVENSLLKRLWTCPKTLYK